MAHELPAAHNRAREKRLIKRVTPLLVCGLLVAACGSSGATASSAGAYVIGSSSDLSGALAYEGTGLRDGIRAYFDYVNSQGGVNGHKIKYMPLDDKSNPSTGLANTKELVTQDHAIAILGWGLSNVIQGAQPALSQYGIPIVAQSLTGPMVKPAQPLVYGGDMSIADEASPEVAFAAQKLSGKSQPKVALFTYVSVVDQEFAANVKSEVSQKGWSLAASQVVQLSATDLTAAITQIANSKPDFVIMSLVDPQAVLAATGLRQMGITAPIVNYDGGSAFTTLQQVKDPDFYALRPYGYSTDSAPGVKVFDQATAAAGVKPNAPFVINGYAQAVALVAGLKKCGYPCSSAQLSSTMNNFGSVDTSGLTVAPLRYDSTTHAGVVEAQIYKWDQSKNKPVAASSLLQVGAK